MCGIFVEGAMLERGEGVEEGAVEEGTVGADEVVIEVLGLEVAANENPEESANVPEVET